MIHHLEINLHLTTTNHKIEIREIPVCRAELKRQKSPLLWTYSFNGADEGTIIDTFSIKEYKQIINRIGLLMSNN